MKTRKYNLKINITLVAIGHFFSGFCFGNQQLSPQNSALLFSVELLYQFFITAQINSLSRQVYQTLWHSAFQGNYLKASAKCKFPKEMTWKLLSKTLLHVLQQNKKLLTLFGLKLNKCNVKNTHVYLFRPKLRRVRLMLNQVGSHVSTHSDRQKCRFTPVTASFIHSHRGKPCYLGHT